jgi:hypothetical protein
VVKSELGPDKICWKRERDNYKLPAVASCPYIRILRDVIEVQGDYAQVDSASIDALPCLVFEWMEHDLRTVPSGPFRENSRLPKAIAHSVLSALAVLKTEYDAIHTGECLSSTIYHG